MDGRTGRPGEVAGGAPTDERGGTNRATKLRHVEWEMDAAAPKAKEKAKATGGREGGGGCLLTPFRWVEGEAKAKGH